MKAMLILSMALVLTVGCSSSDSSKKSVGLGGGGNEEKTVDTTDYSLCQKGAPATSPQGSWVQQRATGEFQTSLHLQVFQGSLRMTSVCEMRGHRLQASVASPVTDDGRHLDVLKADKDNQEFKDGEFQMTCNLDLQPMRVNYAFKGACLELTKEGETEKIVMVPSR